MSKKTYIFEKRPISMKRYLLKDTYTYVFLLGAAGETFQGRMSKKTYIFEKRPIPMKNDLYL